MRGTGNTSFIMRGGGGKKLSQLNIAPLIVNPKLDESKEIKITIKIML